MSLSDALKANTEGFVKCAVFQADGTVKGSTFDANTEELVALAHAFDDRDHTVGHGLKLAGYDFEVHRWYAEGEQPGLVYGRRGEPDSGEGICAVKAGSTFGVVTYTYPNVSAKVIPAFVKVVTANV